MFIQYAGGCLLCGARGHLKQDCPEDTRSPERREGRCDECKQPFRKGRACCRAAAPRRSDAERW